MPRKKKDDKVLLFNGGKATQDNQDLYEEAKPSVGIEIPKVSVELVDTSSVEQMSVAEINKRKEQLQAQRERVMFAVDSKKLAQATKLVTLMDNTLDQMSAILFSPDESGEINAKAYKDLADAYDRMSRNLSSLSRLDTNCNGEFTEIHLTIERR